MHAINALVKLSTRLSVDTTNTIREILLRYGSSLDVELQQRALEYSVIFTKYDQMRTGLLEAMPAYEKDLDESQEMPISEETGPDLVNFDESEENKNNGNAQESNQDLLADLLSGGEVPQENSTAKPVQESTGSALGDLLAMGNTSAPVQNTNNGGLGDLLGISENNAPEETVQAPPPQQQQKIEVYNEDGLKISLSHSKEPETTVARFEATIESSNSNEFEDFTFQVAVPKTQQLQMLAPSGTTLSITEPITQVFRVNNPESGNIRLRLRIVYKVNGEEVVKMGEAKGIPENWN